MTTPTATTDTAVSGVDLSDDDRRLLDFEARWWRHPGAREQAIRDTFGCSPVRYYQRLNRLIEIPAALAASPGLVNRLRRSRDALAARRGVR